MLACSIGTAAPLCCALASPLALWLVSLAMGGLCAYLDRFQMNPDGLSYLDIASELSIAVWRTGERILSPDIRH
jgi:hypothetical protein